VKESSPGRIGPRYQEIHVTDQELDQLCINTIRTLSMDAVQAANSGVID
jgi:hypothetical protein